jgi:Cytochrome c oxidase subunit IV
MRIIFWLMVGLGAFGLAIGTIYWFVSYEVAGSVLLWVFGLMPLIVASWIGRRLREGATTPAADDPGSDPGDEAGEVLGSFPTGSAWPLFLALALLATGAAVVYGAILVPLGVGLVAFTILGWMRESLD